MAAKKRNRRITTILIGAIALASGTYLLLSALNQNVQHFYNPSEVVVDGFVADSEMIRLGGIVVTGSIEKGSGLVTHFQVADFEREMPVPVNVTYDGVLPDLFREGQGVVVTGQLTGRYEFTAAQVLAKHDENYKPKIKYREEHAKS